MIRDCLEDEKLVRWLRRGERPAFAMPERMLGLRPGAWPTLEAVFEAITARDFLAACRSVLNTSSPARSLGDFGAYGAWAPVQGGAYWVKRNARLKARRGRHRPPGEAA